MSQLIGKEIKYEDVDGGAWKQGWEIKVEDFEKSHPTVPNNVPLQVYVVPHSHNDPGWIYTFEGYYDSKTRHILDAVTSQLSQVWRSTFRINIISEKISSLCLGRNFLLL